VAGDVGCCCLCLVRSMWLLVCLSVVGDVSTGGYGLGFCVFRVAKL
jgi:hypothetical protein